MFVFQFGISKLALYLELTSSESISIFLAIKILLLSLIGGAIHWLTTDTLLYLSPGRGMMDDIRWLRVIATATGRDLQALQGYWGS